MAGERDASVRQMYSLEGKVALVTGGTGMLGWQHCTALVEAGARVVVVDLPAKDPESRAKTLPGGMGIGLACDVTDEAQVRELMSAVVARFGRLDVVVNDASIVGTIPGTDVFAPFDEYPLAAWDAVLKANLTGTFLVCREAGKIMRLNGGGSVINISSLYGVVGPDHRIYEGLPFNSFVAYAASKAGILGLTRWLATYWAKDHIRVNAIVPGGVYNNHDPVFVERYANRTPMGRMADKTELIGIVIFLASDASSYCTGHPYYVDGGLCAW